MRAFFYLATVLLSLFISACGGDYKYSNTVTPADRPTVTLILSQTRTIPIAVKGSDGQYHLVYELELRNVTQGSAVIEQVEVLDPEQDSVLASFSGQQIMDRLQLGGGGLPSTSLGLAQFAVMYLHLTFTDNNTVPLTLQHRIRAALEVPAPPEFALSLSEVSAVRLAPVAVLGPPMRGKNYIAADGCCKATRHIRALLPINGNQWLAQRYAIDWEQLDDQNRLFVGDAANVNSYHIYGNDVLAVADATVSVAVDGYPDQVPGGLPRGLDVADADGNHIILDLGNGLYVLYAHLQPGSIAVKNDDAVKRGQVIGRVGNSGNTTAPHLHLHVMDSPSGLIAEGLPYVFDNYRITGINLAGTEDFDNAELTGVPATITRIDPPTQHSNELPLDLTVVDWLNE
ncbi:MAG: M23 family metallopeptidase [Candidatus Competibacteraceae bacterium]|jgi:hypothetical protein|nr:M23 family metallopeptidase [Candidatus Competibacteraceae bacterium]